MPGRNRLTRAYQAYVRERRSWRRRCRQKLRRAEAIAAQNNQHEDDQLPAPEQPSVNEQPGPSNETVPRSGHDPSSDSDSSSCHDPEDSAEFEKYLAEIHDDVDGYSSGSDLAIADAPSNLEPDDLAIASDDEPIPSSPEPSEHEPTSTVNGPNPERKFLFLTTLNCVLIGLHLLGRFRSAQSWDQHHTSRIERKWPNAGASPFEH